MASLFTVRCVRDIFALGRSDSTTSRVISYLIGRDGGVESFQTSLSGRPSRFVAFRKIHLDRRNAIRQCDPNAGIC